MRLIKTLAEVENWSQTGHNKIVFNTTQLKKPLVELFWVMEPKGKIIYINYFLQNIWL